MELENQYKLLVLGYYGMMYLDDYDLKVYILKDIEEQEIILDFKDVKVLTPSWAAEFITGLKNKTKFSITYKNTDNPSIKAVVNLLF